MSRCLFVLCLALLSACDSTEEIHEVAEPAASHYSDLEALEGVAVPSAEVHLRLILQPTFQSPLVYDYRMEVKGESGQVRVRRYSGKAGYDAGSVELDYSRELSGYEASLMLAHIEESRFWELPAEELEEEPFGDSGKLVPLAGLDGDTYILEAKTGDRFHSLWRWQALMKRPDTGKPSDIAVIAKHIIDVAGIVPYKRER